MSYFRIDQDEAYWKMPPGLELLEQGTHKLRLALFPIDEIEQDPPAAILFKMALDT
jgi:hypothetical protein